MNTLYIIHIAGSHDKTRDSIGGRRHNGATTRIAGGGGGGGGAAAVSLENVVGEGRNDLVSVKTLSE